MTFDRFVDSHTEGEPTRVLLGNARGGGRPEDAFFPTTLPELLARLDRGGVPVVPDEWLARAAHPRAADATVCALVCRPSRPEATCGVLFWNAAAPLAMCGHATIGLARTLAHLGVPLPGAGGRAILETRAGEVRFALRDDGRVSFENVPARVHARDVEVVLEQGGVARGDLAWGGNWFFIVRLDGPKGRAMRSIPEELAYAESILRGIRRMELRAGLENGGLVDHVELVFRPTRPDADARNLVLCPNGTFDRSPCGTGTSALLASLAARGELAEGVRWRQESAIGSIFEARYARALGDDGEGVGSRRAGVGRVDAERVGRDAAAVVPTITGRAHLVAEGRFVDDPGDPSRALGWKDAPAGIRGGAPAGATD